MRWRRLLPSGPAIGGLYFSAEPATDCYGIFGTLDMRRMDCNRFDYWWREWRSGRLGFYDRTFRFILKPREQHDAAKVLPVDLIL